jgi:hypothetical protein
MFHAFCTAGFSDASPPSESTTYEPAIRRTTRISNPTRMALIATIRRTPRRRPRASQIATAHSAIGTSHNQVPRNFSSRVRSCAVSSWSACMISTLPASGPNRSATLPTIATRSPS